MPRMSAGSSGASCDVSLSFSWGSGSLYWAWHRHDNAGSGSFLWNLTSPVTVVSEVLTQRSTDMSRHIQVYAAGTDFLTCLIFRVQNPSQRTMNSWWAWGSSQKKKKKESIGHFSGKAYLLGTFILSACFQQRHTQGKKPIVCEWRSHLWLASLIFNTPVWGSGSYWLNQTLHFHFWLKSLSASGCAFEKQPWENYIKEDGGASETSDISNPFLNIAFCFSSQSSMVQEL